MEIGRRSITCGKYSTTLRAIESAVDPSDQTVQFPTYLSRITTKADRDTPKKPYTINMRFQLAVTRSCTIPQESLQTMERTEIVVGRIVTSEFFMGAKTS